MPRDETCQCGSALEEIKVFTHAMGGHSPSAQLEFGDADARRSFWLGQLEARGHVEAWRCPRCWRIYFYGVPEDES